MEETTQQQQEEQHHHHQEEEEEEEEQPMSPILQLNVLRRSRALRRLNLDPQRAAAVAAAAAAAAAAGPPTPEDNSVAEEELATLLNTTLRTSMVRQELEQDELERQRNLAVAEDKANKDAVYWERAHKTATRENRELVEKVKRLEVALAQEKLKKIAREDVGLRHAYRAKKAEEELFGAEKALATHRSQVQGKDVRLLRALEEVEKLKKALTKEQAAHNAETARVQVSMQALQARVKKLEKEKECLKGAFHKQGKLVEVLKLQKQHVQAAHLLSFTEQEYNRLVLDWQLGHRGESKGRRGRE